MNPPTFDSNDAILLNHLDSQITEIMLSAERACSCKSINRQPWSPQQRQIAGTGTNVRKTFFQLVSSKLTTIFHEHINRRTFNHRYNNHQPEQKAIKR
jgi:uncharacterized protein YaaW (UPF0174 family)